MNESERADQVQLAVRGDADALQCLIVEYHGPLYGTIEGRIDTALRRHVDPDDVLQEAYAAAFRSIKDCSFDGPAGFYKWLEAIALNQLKEIGRNLRRQKRDIDRAQAEPPAGLTSIPDLAERLTSGGSTPSRHLAMQEATAAVISSLARLTADQRTVVRLRFLGGRPVAEIARDLNKTEDAIHMLCHRALKQLRAHMGSITHYLSKL